MYCLFPKASRSTNFILRVQVLYGRVLLICLIIRKIVKNNNSDPPIGVLTRSEVYPVFFVTSSYPSDNIEFYQHIVDNYAWLVTTTPLH